MEWVDTNVALCDQQRNDFKSDIKFYTLYDMEVWK